MNLKIAIYSNLKVLFKNPVFLFKKFYYFYFKNLILKNSSDISFKFLNQKLIIPNKIIPILVLEEIFVYEVYNYLSGLHTILDLGAYLGESSVYLSNLNSNVIAYEADKKNFKYIKLNSKNIKNLKVYNKAVVFSNKKESIFSSSEDFDYGGNVSNFYLKSNKKKVKNENIKTIMEKNPNIDGIKMDIEGGEYEILNYFLKNKIFFNFKKGYIEFHFFGKNDIDFKILKSFLTFLKNKNYKYNFFNIINEKLNFKIILEKYNSISKNEEFIFHFIFFKNEK